VNAGESVPAALMALVLLPACAMPAARVSEVLVYSGAFDGSAAVAIGANRFVAATDDSTKQKDASRNAVPVVIEKHFRSVWVTR
jgi:hypothetical protein